MPASTMELMDNALKASLGQKNDNLSLKDQLTAGIKKTCLMEIEYEEPERFECTVLNALKAKYVMLKCPESAAKRDEQESDDASKDKLKLSPRELYPFDKVKLGWSSGLDWTAGAGMVNMGNTCYMNSTLQALFHIPSLVNWLISDREHSMACQDCIICAMRKTLLETQQRNLTSIRPLLIYNKLRLVCKNLIPGRQEDAHEFLRYLIEAMEKAYIQRFKNHNNFDQKIKETTPLNQILGGYLRSSVRCMKCGHISTMFQHFQDLLLDIRKVQTLEEALDLYFSRENLDDDTYHCESCQKKVPATKQFLLERAPMALCIQLKRFSISNNKLTKHIGFRSRLDLTKYSRQKYKVPLIYRLVSMVTHMGPTVNCGHYTAVAQGPSGTYFQFDDSMVRSIPHQTVFGTNAYIMLYELEMSPYNLPLETPIKSKASSTITEPIPSTNNKNGALSGNRTINGKVRETLPNYSTIKIPKLSVRVGFTSDKVYGPELPPDRLSVTSSSSAGKSKASSSASPSMTDESSSESSEDENSKVTTQSRLSKNEADSSTTNGDATVTSAGELPSTTEFASSPTGSEATSNVKIANKSLSKSLVPYETGDTSGSEDSNNSEDVGTSKSGEWQVTSSTDVATQVKSTRNGSLSSGTSKNVVNELFKLSSSGYSAPVSTWNGTRSQLDKIVQQEKREERKRSLADSSSNDQGRAKRLKLSSSCGKEKSNPGYNPVQEYHNMKNWSNGNGSSMNNGYHNKQYQGNRHKRNFHHKNGFHKNNHRFR